MSSLLYTLGGAGFLLATTPLAWASATIGWRSAFWLMAAVTAFLALLLYSVVRDAPEGHTGRERAPETASEIWAGLKAVANRQLWYICAIQFVSYGTVLAVVGLWAGPYLNDVHGLDGVARGNVLLVLNVAMLVGVMSFSVIERWLTSRKWTIGCGALLSVALLLVLALTPNIGLWAAATLLVLFALASAYIMLIHAHARALLPDHLVGRGLTLQNLAVFLGVFVIQSITGFIVGGLGVTGDAAPESAYRAVFGFLAVVTLSAVAIYLRAEDVPTRPEGGAG
jgi:predicted MFS family arabinose efflux permease